MTLYLFIPSTLSEFFVLQYCALTSIEKDVIHLVKSKNVSSIVTEKKLLDLQFSVILILQTRL